jgi:hypothetical protein
MNYFRWRAVVRLQHGRPRAAKILDVHGHLWQNGNLKNTIQ